MLQNETGIRLKLRFGNQWSQWRASQVKKYKLLCVCVSQLLHFHIWKASTVHAQCCVVVVVIVVLIDITIDVYNYRPSKSKKKT